MSWKTGLSVVAARAACSAATRRAARRRGLAGRALGIERVREHAIGCEVEGRALHVRADEHGRVGPRRVTHAELVEDVRVGRREIGDRVVAPG